MLMLAKEIEELLLCTKCNKRYDTPKMLPCGLFICVSCENEILNENNSLQYKCICSINHDKPKNGLPSNTRLAKLVQVESCSYVLLKYPGERLMKLKEMIETSDQTIHEYCDSIKYDIDVCVESIIQSVQEHRDKLIAQVDEYEKECLLNNKNNQLINFTDEINEKYQALKVQILDENISENEYKEIEQSIKDIDQQVSFKMKTLNYHLFCGKKMKFYQNNQPSSNIVGSLGFESFESLIERFKSISNLVINYKLKYIGIKQSMASFYSFGKNRKVVLYVLYENNQNELHLYDENELSLKESAVQTIDNCTSLFKKLNSIFTTKEHILLISQASLNAKNCEYEILYFTYDLKKVNERFLEKKPSDAQVALIDKRFYFIYNGYIEIYDIEFNHIVNFGQSHNINKEYFLPEILNLSIENGLIYVYDGSNIHLLDELTGTYIKLIELNKENCLFKVLNSKMILLCKTDKILSIYDNNGELIDSLKIECVKNIDSLDINQHGDFLINDEKSGCLYLNEPLF